MNSLTEHNWLRNRRNNHLTNPHTAHSQTAIIKNTPQDRLQNNHTFNAIEQRYEKKESITGVPTGYPDLDDMTGGLQRSDLIILAARPSMGKTAFCLNVAQNAASDAVNAYSPTKGKTDGACTPTP